MDQILTIIGALLDQPAILDPAATFVASVIRAKFPAQVDKGLFDFLALVATKGNAK